MKTVLFYINNLGGGGAEKVLCDVIANINKEKYDVTVMSKYDEGIYVNEIKKYVKYKPLFKKIKPGNNPIKKILNVIYTRLRENIFKFNPNLLYRLYINQKFDIEVAFLEGFSTKVISGSNNKNSKKIAWVHADYEQNHWTNYVYTNLDEEIKTYKKFDIVACVSKNVAKSFNKVIGIKGNVVLKYNPVNKANIIAKGNLPLDLKKEGTITLISVGRLVPQKGYDRLLNVCKRLKIEGYNFNLWILGEGEQRNYLEKFISEHNLKNNVKLLGFQTNPYNYIKNADVFVCSSQTEGFSTVATEAIILGKPVLTTDCSGMNELLEFGEYGIIVENNEEGLHKGIKQVISNQTYLLKYQKKAIERGNYFNLENTMKAIEDIL